MYSLTDENSIFRSNKGFSLTEVMIATGLLGFITLGVTSLMLSMQKEQRRNTLLQVLTSQKTQFENVIRNSISWANTLAASGGTSGVNTHCLVNQQPCSTITIWSGSYSTSYQTLVLRDGGSGVGGIFYDGTAADGSKQGFTESGAACNTFTTAATGNDACPIGYRVSWAPQSTSSLNPKITIYVKMIYNPSDSNPFKTFVNASATSTQLNAKYDVKFDRTAASTSKSFFVSYIKSISGATCSTYGFGACATTFKSFGVAPTTGLGGVYTIINDMYNLIDSTVTTAVRIKYPGYYRCNAKSYAFATDMSYLQIYQTNHTAGTVIGPVSTMASNNRQAYSTLVIDGTFHLAQDNTDLVLQQKCDLVPPTGADCALGFTMGAFTTAEIATLNCVLSD